MELQSSLLNVNNNASLQTAKDGSALLSAANSTSSQSQKNSQSSVSLSSSSSAVFVDSSSVVTKLVSGPAAAAALYGEVVSNTSNEVATTDAHNHSHNVSASQAVEHASDAVASKAKVEQAELAVVKELAARDREVKAHEQTHAAIGGSFASAPTFDYTSGPDGRLYATSGEVSIDTSAIADNPQATLEKAQVIIRAALSVSEPSSADRAVAAEAKSLALRAVNEIRESSSQDSRSVFQDDPKVSSINVVEQQQLEREEYLAEEELKQAKQDRNEALTESRRQSTDASLEVLKEYNSQIHEIQEKLRKLNVQLVDSGAFSKLFPEGALIDQIV
jgi:hypothetical protein